MSLRACALAILLAGCGTSPTTPPAPAPDPSAAPTGPPLPVRAACTVPGDPVPVPAGASVAVLLTEEEELTLFLVDDLTGCWIRLDPSQAPPGVSALAAHPSGRFVFASGQIASGKAGVAAYAIVPERAALDGLGGSWMEQQWWDHPGELAVTERAVYMLSGGPHTGYHGGFWRWAFDPGDGGLTWRGTASSARDPFFVQLGPGGDFLYLGTEVFDPGFRNVAVTLRINSGGSVTAAGETTLAGRGRAVADPSGTFLWLLTFGRRTRLEAYRPAGNGALGTAEGVDWSGREPVPHPGGRVLYTATATHVESWAVDPLRGTPRRVAQVPYAGGDRQPLAVHPSGRFLYAASRTEVHAFRVDEAGGLEDFGRVAPGGTHLVLARP